VLPALPRGWSWLNPVRGHDFVRDEWVVIRAVPGGSQTGPVVRREGAAYTLTPKACGPVPHAQSMHCLDAFNAAAVWAHDADAPASVQDSENS